MRRGLLLLAIVLPACDAADDALACDVIATAPRGVSINGVNLNGTGLRDHENQGTALNGTRLPEHENQGTAVNGTRAPGHELQGTSLVGFRLDGRAFAPLELHGTTLVGVDADGAATRDLVGGVLRGLVDSGEVIELTIDAIDRDDITYYALSIDGFNICGEDGRGLFVAGTWDDSGAHRETARDDFDHTFSCTTGVIAKCVAWGYAPDVVGADAHQTCTRLARADYCGDGVTYTRDGTEIDVFDRLGVQRPVPDDDSFRFEAGWGPDGAVCVDAPRYDMVLPDGEEFLPPCWADLPRCATEAEAVQHGALLSNRSHGDLRNVCAP